MQQYHTVNGTKSIWARLWFSQHRHLLTLEHRNVISLV